MRSLGIAGLAFLCALIGVPASAAVNAAANITALKMPPVERQWSERDYATALTLFRQGSAADLPRAASPVLQQLVNPQNLAILTDTKMPLDSRLRLGARLVQATTDILRLYLAALNQDPSRNDDVIWVEAFMLQEASILVRLADQSLAGVDPAKPDYAERAGGLTQMKAGLREVVVGCIMALQSNDPAAARTREHLAGVLNAEWPKIAALLPPSQKHEIEAALKLLAAHEADPGVKAAFAGF